MIARQDSWHIVVRTDSIICLRPYCAERLCRTANGSALSSFNPTDTVPEPNRKKYGYGIRKIRSDGNHPFRYRRKCGYCSALCHIPRIGTPARPVGVVHDRLRHQLLHQLLSVEPIHIPNRSVAAQRTRIRPLAPCKLYSAYLTAGAIPPLRYEWQNRTACSVRSRDTGKFHTCAHIA